MRVKELEAYLHISSDDEREIQDIVMSTEDIRDGCIFISIRGRRVDPLKQLSGEASRRCLLILSDDPTSPYQYVPSLKERCFDLLDYYFFGHRHSFQMIGITGTEGKSSLARILYQGLSAIGKRAAVVTTEPFGKDAIGATLTTPPPRKIIDAMLQAEQGGYDYLILEVSSIGICEHRVDAEIFDWLFLTNLESDHLEYHGNLYHYHMSKLGLFEKNIRGIKYALSKTYEKYPHRFDRCTNLKIIDEGKILLKNNSLDHQVFMYQGQDYYTHLIFAQNRRNLVFLIEFLRIVHPQNLYETVKRIRRVKGRLDLIHSRPYVLIDYAHSPRALEELLKQLSSFRQDELTVVIGAGGNRDRAKRKEYGDICARFADRVLVTNDNPRDEDPSAIADAIVGAHKQGFEIVLNRARAIETAIREAKRSGIVAIVGRGDEQYQQIGSARLPLNDYEVAERCLALYR